MMVRSALFGAAALALTVTACATAPPASDPEKLEANAAFLDCLRVNARKLDDRRSDAATVARALRPLCSEAWHASQEVYIRQASPAVRRAYLIKTEAEDTFTSYATAVVLQERK
jgi:hypothetical protein